MSSPFTRTLRSLDADDGRVTTAGVLVAVATLAGWGAWLGLARVPVYETSVAARVEAGRAVYPVESSVGARVVANRMTLGAMVNEGDVLLELDVAAQVLERQETRTRLDAVRPQLVALREQLAAAERALRDGSGELSATSGAARARLREARERARQARMEAERAERLARLGHGSTADAERARSEADAREAEVDAAHAEQRRLSLDSATRVSSRRVDIARIQGEIARLEGEQTTLQASLERLDLQTRRHVVRAPVSGRLGSVVELREASVVTAGQRLAVVVPDGELRVVAEFAPPAALGRIHRGQPARVRLDGFPWAQWGMVQTRVRSVGSEARDGVVRVELALAREAPTRIPLEHGLPGSVEVEVERVAPAVLVLRAAGQLVAGRAQTTERR